MSDSVRQYAVVLLFDEATDLKAIELSERYLDKAKDRSFKLDLSSVLPHLSHLHVMLDEEGVEKAKAAIDGAAAATGKALTGEFTELSVTYDRWLFWNTPKTPELLAQHRAVVEAVAPLRKGKVPVGWKMSEMKARMHEAYGFPNVLDAFDPHVTVQILKDRFRNLPPRAHRHRWKAQSLSLVRTGRNASAQEIVHDAFFLR